MVHDVHFSVLVLENKDRETGRPKNKRLTISETRPLWLQDLELLRLPTHSLHSGRLGRKFIGPDAVER